MAVISSGAGSGVMPGRGVADTMGQACKSCREVLDQVQELLESRQVASGMELLMARLSAIRHEYGSELWELLGSEAVNHPVSRLIWQDPFTSHSFRKPRGYPGDAELLDYIYGLLPVPAETSELGASIFRFNGQRRAPRSVRARAAILAEAIDQTASQVRMPKILSIASGHLREAGLSRAVMAGTVGEFVALDQDERSLAEVEKTYASKGVRTVRDSVRSILAGKVTFRDLDLVYAAGLYDYLGDRLATRLTRVMFDMLAPGGRLIIANFAPCLSDIGYIESFMGWKLIYREPEQMIALAGEIASSEWKSHRLFWDEYESIILLEVVKRSAPRLSTTIAPNLAGAVAVPGRSNLTLGPAVTSRMPRKCNGNGHVNGNGNGHSTHGHNGNGKKSHDAVE
jgi:extracellular factor (EF) 3-hydroxypalmitic acid methyl ester biosynthesis protein